MNLVSAKCPNCGANLNLFSDKEKVACDYCGASIIVKDAIACYKIKVSGSVSVDGIETYADLIASGNELIRMNEFLMAKKKFAEFSEKCPDNYQGWLGLLICRTRNFGIKDDNIMFEHDVKNYYEHFMRTAPENIKNEYFGIIEEYLNPKSKKIEKSSDFNVAEIPKVFIVIGFLIIIGFSFLMTGMFLAGCCFFAASVFLAPKINEKLKLSNKWCFVICGALIVLGLFVSMISSSYVFEGVWVSVDDEMVVELSDTDVALKVNGAVFEGEVEHEFVDGEYIIEVDVDSNIYGGMVFRYNSSLEIDKRMCLLENNECIKYFVESE